MLATLARPTIQGQVNWTPLDPRWYTADPGINRAWSGQTVTSENAIQLSVVYRAINVLAHAVASIPLVIYHHLDEDGKERARNHPQYDLLHDKPNAFMTSFRWRMHVMTQKVLWGKHYSEIVSAANGRITALKPLSPRTTRVVDQLADGRLLYVTRDEYVNGFGNERRLVQDEVFHHRGFSLDGIDGLPLPKIARNAMGLAFAAEKHGSVFLRRGAQFAGVLTSDLPMEEEARKENERAWQRARGGPEGSGGTPMLTGGLKYTPISQTNKDSQWLESRTFQTEELLRFIGVPGVLCGYADKTSTYASAEQFFLSFVTHTVHPETEQFAQELNASVVTGAPEYFADFVLEGLLKGDIKTRYAAHESSILAGWKTRNEVRLEESYNRGPASLDEFVTPTKRVTPATDNVAPSQDTSTEPSDASTAGARDPRYIALITRTAARLARKENTSIFGAPGKLGAAKRFASDAAGWKAWAADFYAEFAEQIAADLNVSEDLAHDLCGRRAHLAAQGIAAIGDPTAFEADAITALTTLALSSTSSRTSRG